MRIGIGNSTSDVAAGPPGPSTLTTQDRIRVGSHRLRLVHLVAFLNIDKVEAATGLDGGLGGRSVQK